MSGLLLLVILEALVALGFIVHILLRRRQEGRRTIAASLGWKLHGRQVMLDRIDTALAEQRAYEEAHAVRQQKRVKVNRKITPRPSHGHYDDDQRRQSVLLKVRAAYRLADENEPPGLDEAVREALR